MNAPRLSIIPARAATDRSLQPRDLQVLCVLGRHTDDLGWCFRSQVKMAAEMGCARSTVQLAVERLIGAGYLERHVQETENGRDAAHRYRVILDPVHPAPETVPLYGPDAVENPVDDEGKNGGETPADTSAPLPIDRHPLPTQDRHPLPTHGSAPINDSSLTTPLNDRERARARGEDQKRIERWLKRVHPSWPTHIADSTPKALAAAMALDEDEREEAAARMADYIDQAKAGGRKHLCSFAVYLAEKRWEKLPAPSETKAASAVSAAAFGRNWGAARMAALLRGPSGIVPALTRIEEKLIEAGKFEREALIAEKRMKAGWPEVNAMHQKAERRIPATVSARFDAVASDMEPVPVGCATFEAWRVLHEERGWPWIPDPTGLQVVWFPRGGPQGLQAFEAALQACAGGPDEGRTGAAPS